MAAIYAADIYCDDCADNIKLAICDELWTSRQYNAECPDGTSISNFDNRSELDSYLQNMDEHTYESDAYPKWRSDYAESDCPEHCGNGAECINAEQLSDGFKIGQFLGSRLTSYGVEYVKEAVQDDLESGRAGSVAVKIWAPYYDLD
jgi:hypothetical protein